jgi:hypothetical protein
VWMLVGVRGSLLGSATWAWMVNHGQPIARLPATEQQELIISLERDGSLISSPLRFFVL